MHPHILNIFVTLPKCKQLEELGLKKSFGPVYREYFLDSTNNLNKTLAVIYPEFDPMGLYGHLTEVPASYSEHTAFTLLDMLFLLPDYTILKEGKAFALATDQSYGVDQSTGLYLPDVAANHVISYITKRVLSAEYFNTIFSSLNTIHKQ